MKGVGPQLGRVGLGRGRSRAGMTLVELLIALALMVAVAGLALPNLFSILARSTAEEGRRQALAALASARAEAIGAGEPVRVMAEPTAVGGGWRLRAVAVEAADDIGQAVGSGGSGGGGTSAWLDDADRWQPETVAALPSGWVVLTPEAVDPMGGPVAGRPAPGPTSRAGAGGSRPVAQRPDHSGARQAVEPIELVTFLPDGGAIAPASPARFGAGKQQFALKIDRWTGRATLTIDRGETESDEGEPGEMDERMPGDDELGESGFGDELGGDFDEEDPQW